MRNGESSFSELSRNLIAMNPASSWTMAISNIIAKLRQKGFLVEIDDFGKGYSSMSLLRDVAADMLKIDMSLLRDFETKQRNRIIVESIVSMATALGMSVVVEGVETKEQLQLLAAMGCRYFQGYYFSRPIPVGEFEAKCGSGSVLV